MSLREWWKSKLGRLGAPLFPHNRWVQEGQWLDWRRRARRARLEGRYQETEHCLRRALAVAEGLGEGDPLVGSSLEALAELYEVLGEYQKAEPFYSRLVHWRENFEGRSSPGTVSALNSLALLYYTQGVYERALPVYRELIRRVEEDWGPEHRELAVILDNFAALQRKLKREDLSEQLLKRAREIRARQRGSPPGRPGSGGESPGRI